MSKIYETECDMCYKIVKSEYNGEHWLPPKDWYEVVEVGSGDFQDIHICPECFENKLRKNNG